MARNKDINQELRKQSEIKITDAAMELFASKGFAATKTGEIVKKAGISQGLLYHYFPDKKDLYEKCLERCCEESGNYVSRLLSNGATGSEKIISFTKGILSDIEKSDWILHQFILFIRLSLEENNQELISKYERLPVTLLEDVIKQAREEGSAVQGDIRVLSVLYWATLKGVCIHMMSKNTKYPVPDSEMLYRILLK